MAMNMNQCATSMKNPSRQQGVALVMSLIMLLLITIIGVSAVRMTSIDTQMAGNSIYSILVFQGAESGLGKSKDFYNIEQAARDGSIDVDESYFNEEKVSGGAALITKASLAYQSDLESPPYSNQANSSTFEYKLIQVIAQSELASTSAKDIHTEGVAVQKQSQ